MGSGLHRARRTAPGIEASRLIAPPVSVRRSGGARRGARHVAASIERLAERLAGLAGLDPGCARPRGGIEGLAADRATGIGPAGAARHIEGLAADRTTGDGPGASRASRPIAGLDAGAARHRLAPRPVVRRIGIDEGACGWQVYPQ
jgi:hypothetical protein